jgi:integral membrane protein
MESVKAAVLWYRVLAYVTGTALIVLCFVGIPLQAAGKPAVAQYVGVLHGFLYIIYLVCAWILARKLRLQIKPTVIMLLAGVVPVMTFVVERWVTRRFINPALAGQAHRVETVSRERALLLTAAGGAAPPRPGAGRPGRCLPGAGDRRRSLLPRPA